MLKIRITFMRHGHAINGKVDKIRPLSTIGKLQAKQRPLYLKTQPLFDLIITSSATRAIKTAQIIVDEIDIHTLLLMPYLRQLSVNTLKEY